MGILVLIGGTVVALLVAIGLYSVLTNVKIKDDSNSNDEGKL